MCMHSTFNAKDKQTGMKSTEQTQQKFALCRLESDLSCIALTELVVGSTPQIELQ